MAVRNGARHVATNSTRRSRRRGGRSRQRRDGRGRPAVTGQEPLVTGKPDPAMHAECVRRTGARRPLVVGDRLDTDIEGARRAGAASLLVLTGVTDPAHAARRPARPPARPARRRRRGLLRRTPPSPPTGRLAVRAVDGRTGRGATTSGARGAGGRRRRGRPRRSAGAVRRPLGPAPDDGAPGAGRRRRRARPPPRSTAGVWRRGTG